MKRAFTLVEAVVVVAILLFLAAILFPVFARRDTRGRRAICQMNLKQIGLGMIQYVQDYDERYPPARASASSGWADLLQPYLKNTQIFQCDKAPSAATGTFTTDYFFNRRLARMTLSKINSPATTLMSGDGDDNAPTWNSWTNLPFDAVTNTDSPSQRHLGFANYGYADGHVKALKADKISIASPGPRTNEPTFAVR